MAELALNPRQLGYAARQQEYGEQLYALLETAFSSKKRGKTRKNRFTNLFARPDTSNLIEQFPVVTECLFNPQKEVGKPLH